MKAEKAALEEERLKSQEMMAKLLKLQEQLDANRNVTSTNAGTDTAAGSRDSSGDNHLF